jgi:hypothetical protein
MLFIVTLCRYNYSAYDTNWNSANDSPYVSTNNTFNFDLININFTVQNNNPGCSDVVWWQTAQSCSLRNSIMTRSDVAIVNRTMVAAG